MTDELCTCGHLKSQHGDVTARVINTRLEFFTHPEPNHGQCMEYECSCNQFTFKKEIQLTKRSDINKFIKKLSNNMMHQERTASFCRRYKNWNPIKGTVDNNIMEDEELI